MKTEENKVLRIVYTFFLGLLLAIFIGVGIKTFYEGPKPPEYPETTYPSVTKEATDEQTVAQREYNEDIRAYGDANKVYNRNVSIAALVGSVLLVVGSLLFERRIKFIADGVMLGGLFTLIYSIIRSFASEDSKYIFAVVSVGLALVLYLGYHRFVRTRSADTKTDVS